MTRIILTIFLGIPVSQFFMALLGPESGPWLVWCASVSGFVVASAAVYSALSEK